MHLFFLRLYVFHVLRVPTSARLPNLESQKPALHILYFTLPVTGVLFGYRNKLEIGFDWIGYLHISSDLDKTHVVVARFCKLRMHQNRQPSHHQTPLHDTRQH